MALWEVLAHNASAWFGATEVVVGSSYISARISN